MNRADWQQLAEEKLRSSAVLLAANEWSSAFYLAGYAVECGLKSCILVRLTATPELVFDDRRFSEKCWTHDFEALAVLASIDIELKAEIGANPAFETNWETVNDWNEKSRYLQKSQLEAQELFDAIIHPTDGVMTWIRNRW